MDYKKEFITLYNKYIKREGADKLLEFLESDKSDFFTAPASTRYHNSYEGGLVEHSVVTYECMVDYLARQRVKETYGYNCDDETAAVAALLHDVCKINCYKPSTRNRKDDDGNWVQIPWYDFEDELPYGHGEKSVYIISGFMKLSREEAFAIRYHMGFSREGEDVRAVTKAFTMFPLAFALSTADMEATYFVKGRRP